MEITLTPKETAQKILDVITYLPAKWRQEVWIRTNIKELSVYTTDILEHMHSCGTTACVAGWGAIHAAPSGSKVVSTGTIQFPDGNMYFVYAIAAKALGLASYQADWLFDPFRSKNAVVWALNQIITDDDFDSSDWNRTLDRPYVVG